MGQLIRIKLMRIMKNVLASFIWIIMLSTVHQVTAQQSFISHLSKPYYCQGEQVFYKLYFPNNYATKNVAVNIRLYNGDALMQQFYQKSEANNYIAGLVDLPLDYSSGNYTLSFLVADGTQKIMETVNEISFPIYNDLSTEITNVKSNVASLSKDQSSIDIKLVTDPTINSRSKNEIRVQLSNPQNSTQGAVADADVSIAIVDKKLVFGEETPIVSVSSNSKYSIVNPSDRLSVFGFASNDAGNAQALNVIGAWSLDAQEFSFTKAIDNGNFFLELDDFEGDQSIQFVRYDDSKDNVNYSILKPSINRVMSGETIPQADINEYLSDSRKRRKLNQYFGLRKKVSLNENPIEKKEFLKPNTTYLFSEFKRFETLGGFFGELSTALSLRKQDDGSYVCNMLKPKSRTVGSSYLGDTPLFIIDGMISKDPNFFGRLNFDDMARTDLHFDTKSLRQMFNAMGKNGAVVVETKLPEFQLQESEQSDIITLSGIQSGNTSFEFSDSEINLSTSQPLFSSLIYWNPYLKSDSTGQITVSYNHTDDVGESVMIIFVRAKDGTIGWQTIDLDVKS